MGLLTPRIVSELLGTWPGGCLGCAWADLGAGMPGFHFYCDVAEKRHFWPLLSEAGERLCSWCLKGACSTLGAPCPDPQGPCRKREKKADYQVSANP